VANHRLVREVKYQEIMFELLAKQYELARVDESKEAPLIQVVDRARPPERRTRPRRTLLVIAAAAVALFGAVLATFAEDALADAARDPARQAKLAALRAAWRRRAPGASTSAGAEAAPPAAAPGQPRRASGERP
jgi:hypothetical protein